MEEEKIDMVIFGASGFTGKYVVREALRFLNSPPHALNTIGLAGRNPAKVEAALRWATAPSPPPPLPIFKADVSDPSSLSSLCRRARLLLNCVGPYRLYGEPVVAACVEAGTDYLDITGEPEFMERMEAKYREWAAETGALVVSACGFDSIPAEMGGLFNSRQWVPPSLPHSVEAYLVLGSEKRIVGNIATLESSVLGFANVEELQKLRRSRPKPPKLQVIRIHRTSARVSLLRQKHGYSSTCSLTTTGGAVELFEFWTQDLDHSNMEKQQGLIFRYRRILRGTSFSQFSERN